MGPQIPRERLTLTGKVYLVGGGPGDPGLITVKGLRCLQEADVVVYDRLVDPRVVALASGAAERIYVGKGRGERAMEQEEINRLLIVRAREGKVVVRLKGGDPFVFGRGGEETQALASAGISFEVVPGITSAIAAPAYAGIPLTHRGLASSFTVVSGTEDVSKEASQVDWDRLAMAGGTLVVLMGWNNLPEIVASLVRGGMAPTTPVALVQWGTEPNQRTVVGTLEDIVDSANSAGLAPPMVAVVGEVVKLRQEVRWFDNRPLFGKRVLVTRSRNQASVLVESLYREGAEAVELPAIDITPLGDYTELDQAIGQLGNYQWVVFSSVNAVEALFRRMKTLGRDSRAFGGVRVCAIGPATAEALERQGILPDMIPDQYLSSSVVAEFKSQGLSGARVLLPRADIAPDTLVGELEALGAAVHQVTAYHTVVPQQSRERARELLERGKIDVVTFTSSSTVRNLLELLGDDASLFAGAVVACIGPVTAQTAKEMGLRVDIVAKEHTIAGLVSELVEYYTGHKGDEA